MCFLHEQSGAVRSRERGIVLVAGLIVLLILSGLATALVTTNVEDANRKKSSGARARTVYIAEAGIKFAISDLESGGKGVFGSKASPAAFGGGHYYTLANDLGGGSWSLISVGEMGGERRVIEAIVSPVATTMFAQALFGDLDLGANGNVFTDSYEADKGSYLSQATHYSVVAGRNYAKANGSVGSNQYIQLRGSVVILGDARPGPGYSVRVSGTGVYVEGSTQPMKTAQPVKPYVYAPTIPASGDYSPPNGQTTLTAGTYRFGNLQISSGSTVDIQGDVTLYVDDGFKMSGQGQIVIEDGGSLTIYHGGSDFTMTGGGVLNSNQNPRALKVFSTATNVTFTGTSGFYGAIYAPNAYVTPSGTSEIFGSIVGRQVYISGTADFHYDESLANEQVQGGRLKIVSWRRIDSNAY